MKDKILFSKSDYDNLNSKEKLDEALSKSKNKFEYIHELYGKDEKSFWGLALNFFVDTNVRNNLDEKETEKINNYLQIFLNSLLEKEAMLSVNVLDIINEKMIKFR